MNSPRHISIAAPEPVSLWELTLVLLNAKWHVFAAIVLGGALGFAGSWLVTPQYRANVLLVAAAQDSSGASALAGQLGGLAAIAGFGSVMGGAGRVEAFEYLKSRQIIAELITEEDLLPVLFSERWDAQAKRWLVSEAEVPSLDEGIREFDDRVREITEDKRAGTIELAIVWRDPKQAASWANGLVSRANESLRRQAIQEAQNSIRFLNVEAGKSQVVEVRQTIYRLIEDQYKAITAANVREQFAFRIVDPARVPEARRPQSPRRVLIGVLGGFLLGALTALLLWIRHYRTRFSVS